MSCEMPKDANEQAVLMAMLFDLEGKGTPFS